MTGIFLLLLVTCLYAGYNLLVKQSSTVAALTASSTITATIMLQVVALLCSLVFYTCLRLTGDSEFVLPAPAYMWAALAGLCIGLAEIGYFYLFRGSSIAEAMPVSVATPVIVGGTVVIAMVAAMLFFAETISPRQWVGALLVVAGLAFVAR